MIEYLKVEEGDLLLIVADTRKVVNTSLGYLRTKIAKDMKLIDTSKFKFVWITDWPSFEFDEEEGRYVASHHPFTAPKKEFEDLLLTEPEKCYSTCYDIVLNGYELGSGSIRIHNQKIQSDMFKAIGLSDIEIKEKFIPISLDSILPDCEYLSYRPTLKVLFLQREIFWYEVERWNSGRKFVPVCPVYI